MPNRIPLTIGQPVGHWTPKRKLDLLEAIERGDITRAGAMEMYAVSEDELDSWERHFARRGLDGLSVYRLQEAPR